MAWLGQSDLHFCSAPPAGPYYVGTFGVDNAYGTPFSLACPDGTFINEISGTAGTVVQELAVYCSDDSYSKDPSWGVVDGSSSPFRFYSEVGFEAVRASIDPRRPPVQWRFKYYYDDRSMDPRSATSGSRDVGENSTIPQEIARDKSSTSINNSTANGDSTADSSGSSAGSTLQHWTGAHADHSQHASNDDGSRIGNDTASEDIISIHGKGGGSINDTDAALDQPRLSNSGGARRQLRAAGGGGSSIRSGWRRLSAHSRALRILPSIAINPPPVHKQPSGSFTFPAIGSSSYGDDSLRPLQCPMGTRLWRFQGTHAPLPNSSAHHVTSIAVYCAGSRATSSDGLKRNGMHKMLLDSVALALSGTGDNSATVLYTTVFSEAVIGSLRVDVEVQVKGPHTSEWMEQTLSAGLPGAMAAMGIGAELSSVKSPALPPPFSPPPPPGRPSGTMQPPPPMRSPPSNKWLRGSSPAVLGSIGGILLCVTVCIYMRYRMSPRLRERRRLAALAAEAGTPADRSYPPGWPDTLSQLPPPPHTSTVQGRRYSGLRYLNGRMLWYSRAEGTLASGDQYPADGHFGPGVDVFEQQAAHQAGLTAGMCTGALKIVLCDDELLLALRRGVPAVVVEQPDGSRGLGLALNAKLSSAGSGRSGNGPKGARDGALGKAPTRSVPRRGAAAGAELGRELGAVQDSGAVAAVGDDTSAAGEVPGRTRASRVEGGGGGAASSRRANAGSRDGRGGGSGSRVPWALFRQAAHLSSASRQPPPAAGAAPAVHLAEPAELESEDVADPHGGLSSAGAVGGAHNCPPFITAGSVNRRPSALVSNASSSQQSSHPSSSEVPDLAVTVVPHQGIEMSGRAGVAGRSRSASRMAAGSVTAHESTAAATREASTEPSTEGSAGSAAMHIASVQLGLTAPARAVLDSTVLDNPDFAPEATASTYTASTTHGGSSVADITSLTPAAATAAPAATAARFDRQRGRRAGLPPAPPGTSAAPSTAEAVAGVLSALRERSRAQSAGQPDSNGTEGGADGPPRL